MIGSRLVSRSGFENGQIGRSLILSTQENDKENSMTTKTENISEGGNRSRWQNITTTLKAISEAMSYDPEEHRDAAVRNLWEKVSLLETRVSDMETRDKRVA
jgi:hypothetical protein